MKKLPIGQILEGWGKAMLQIMGMLPESDRERMESRLRHCAECPIRTGDKCDSKKTGRNIQTNKIVKGCGCPLQAATLAKNKSCPRGLW